MNKKLTLPCLKGRIGDWFFYTALMKFEEVAKRVKLPEEIDKKYKNKELELGEWIQRELDGTRTEKIVEYINKNEQRFFNSLILGIFAGSPSWQELQISSKQSSPAQALNEDVEVYLSDSLGVLTLNGNENIFAIDGQHRAIGIREAVKQNKKIASDEVSVIFVAHKTTSDGQIRTRRLFSTLNRYAKPVGKSDIIALSEDDNCAVVTRDLIENFGLLKDKIIVNKSSSISPDNTTDFTNIRTLYEIVERILTNKKVHNIEVIGEEHYSFTNTRVKEKELNKHMVRTKKYLKDSLTCVPAFNEYIKSGVLNGKTRDNLIFRPIGQTIFFDVLKVAESNDKLAVAKAFFSANPYSLNNKVWRTIFWDEEINNIKTDKPRIRFATYLILEHIGIPIKMSKKDLEMAKSFNIDLSQM